MKLFRKASVLSDFWVSNHTRLNDFYLSSWQPGETTVIMLLVRLVLTVLAIGICVWSVVEAPTPYWLCFLTNWGALLLSMMTITGLFVSIMAFCNKIPEEGPMTWYISLYWVMFNVGINITLVISALYWILLFGPDMIDEGLRLFMLEIALHGFTACIALAELLISRTPVYLLHVYQPLAVGIGYAFFTFIYYSAGGTDGAGNPYIYEILDWREGGRSTVLVCLSTVGMLIIYAVVWGLAISRDKLSSYVRTISKDLPFVLPDV